MSFTTRPTLRGFGGAVAAGHYLASQIGARMLADGGNAADAACAMGFALQVLEPTQNGPAGEAPILVWSAGDHAAFAISGQGTAPAAATPAAMRDLGIERIPPDGFLPATVPAAFDAWCRLLERFGTQRLSDVLAPARGLAERGFPMYPFLHGLLRFIGARFREQWPSSAAVYLPLREVGAAQTNPALAAHFADLVAAERDSAGGREAGIRAARDFFYCGRPAEQIERFAANPILDTTGRRHAALLRAADLAGYEGSIESAITAPYRDTQVWKCPPWSQGPAFLQQLRLLEGFDLAAMGRASADALHTWIETAKLAFADRDANYGDPRFCEVPLDRLLSDDYTRRRRELVDPDRASLELRPGMGKLPAGWPLELAESLAKALPVEPQALAESQGRRDTTQCAACDTEGNVVCATPSGGWIVTSPVIPELGFPLGTRAQMFVLDDAHPNVLAPGKRPRTTLSPSLARLGNGRHIAFGTPGGDQQDQWTSQFFLDLVDFGAPDLQDAIDAPTLHSTHMPSSFYPRHAELGCVTVEDRMNSEVLADLEARGHRITRAAPWSHGRVMAVTHDPQSGLCEAAASPRSQVAYAITLP